MARLPPGHPSGLFAPILTLRASDCSAQPASGRLPGGDSRILLAILPPVRLLLARISEAIAPARLGRSFRWLLSASFVNNAGDGIAVTAGPLLVASMTRDPFLVSMALLSEYLPVLVFGVTGGVAAHRFDRKRMVVVVNLGRAFVLVAPVATSFSGSLNIALLLLAPFILVTA